MMLQGLKEIGEALGVPSPTPEAAEKLLRGWISNHGLPVVKVGKRYYADADALAAWKSSRLSSVPSG